jgi:large subunit ribosomal protein L21
MSKIAVIATGGKQYVVSLGDVFEIEKLEGVTKVGEKIVFNDVLLTDDGAKTAVGVPTVTGASVEAELVEEGRGDKITVVRYKAKSRYHKKRGHRQPFTKVKITKIA